MPTPSLQVFQYAVLTDAQGERHLLGSMVDPVNLSTDLEGSCRHYVYTADAGDSLNPDFTTFTLLWVRVNIDGCYLELTTDVNDSVGRQSQTFKLRKNLAFIIGSNVSYADYTTSFAGGTLDVIDRIVIKNASSESATVEVVIAE